MSYTVKHFRPNPRNNSSVEFATKADAIAEAKSMLNDIDSDNETDGGSSMLFDTTGNLLATRDWHEPRLSWVRKREAPMTV